MRRLLLLSSFLLLTISSCRKDRADDAIVIMDCTGSYLRIEGKDYQVCNIEKLRGFANGDVVDASYRRIDACDGSAADAVTCFMLHANEGWIEVKRVR